MTVKQNKAIKELPSEDEEQTKVVAYSRKRNLLVFSIPNGGKRYLLEAVKMKRTGTTSGIPDLFYPMARKGFFGFFLEMKRERGGVINDNQRYWIDTLRKEGYRVEVANGFDEAKIMIDDYFGF